MVTSLKKLYHCMTLFVGSHFGILLSSKYVPLFFESCSVFLREICTNIFCITTLKNVHSMSSSASAILGCFLVFWVLCFSFSFELFVFLWNFAHLILTILWWSQESNKILYGIFLDFWEPFWVCFSISCKLFKIFSWNFAQIFLLLLW